MGYGVAAGMAAMVAATASSITVCGSGVGRVDGVLQDVKSSIINAAINVKLRGLEGILNMLISVLLLALFVCRAFHFLAINFPYTIVGAQDHCASDNIIAEIWPSN